MNSKTLIASLLTAENFAPFGHVLGLDAASIQHHPYRTINSGNALRFDVLPDMQLTQEGGVPTLAIFQAKARQSPLTIEAMERHALGSQTFVPLGTQRFVVVVAPPNQSCDASHVQAFITNGRQGVVLHPGTWHCPLLAVEGGDFVVIERRAANVDCEVQPVLQHLEVQW